MTGRLSHADAAQLRKFVALFDSDNEGERCNAVTMAKRLVSRAGLRLADCLIVALQSEPALRPLPVPPTTPFVRKVLACRDNPALFNQREREFLRDMDLAASSEEFARLVLSRLEGGVPPDQVSARARLSGETWAGKAARFAGWRLSAPRCVSPESRST